MGVVHTKKERSGGGGSLVCKEERERESMAKAVFHVFFAMVREGFRVRDAGMKALV